MWHIKGKKIKIKSDAKKKKKLLYYNRLKALIQASIGLFFFYGSKTEEKKTLYDMIQTNERHNIDDNLFFSVHSLLAFNWCTSMIHNGPLKAYIYALSVCVCVCSIMFQQQQQRKKNFWR